MYFGVRLRNGSFVEATPDHVVKAVAERRTQPAWLRVDQLEVGMRMHLHPHRAKVSDPIRVAVGAGDEARRPLRSSREVDRVEVAEAALAGWLQADGFVGQYTGTNRSLTIEFQVANDDEYDWVTRTWTLSFPRSTARFARLTLEQVRVRRIRLYGEVLRDFVERWEPAGTRHRDARPPPTVHGLARRDRGLPAEPLPGGRLRVGSP